MDIFLPVMPVSPTLDEMIDSFDPARHGGEVMVDKPVGHEEIIENKDIIVGTRQTEQRLD